MPTVHQHFQSWGSYWARCDFRKLNNHLGVNEAQYWQGFIIHKQGAIEVLKEQTPSSCWKITLLSLNGNKLGHRSYLDVMFLKLYMAEDIFCSYSLVRIPYPMAWPGQRRNVYMGGKKRKERGSSFCLFLLTASNKTTRHSLCKLIKCSPLTTG